MTEVLPPFGPRPMDTRDDLGVRPLGFWDSLTDGFYTVDREWRFSFINRAAERALGRSRADLLGSSLWDSVPPIVDSDTYRAYHRAVREQLRLSFDLRSAAIGRLINVAVRPNASGLGVSFRETPAPGKVRGRVLLVDDRRDVSEMLQSLLEEEDYFASIADDLDAARAALDYLPMDAVILDDRLPSGRGSSVQDQAKRHGIRMLVMSGHPASIEEFGRCTSFIAKPFRGADLMKRLQRLMA